MIGKIDKFWGGSEKQSAFELRWRWVADCSRDAFQTPETHDHQQWTAVYVGSVARGWQRLEMVAGDGSGWNRRHAGCSQRDTVAPDHAGIGKWAQPTWNRCVPETAASEGLAAPVWRAHIEKIDVSVQRHCLILLSFGGAHYWSREWVGEWLVWQVASGGSASLIASCSSFPTFNISI